jgi:hypothetical protein
LATDTRKASPGLSLVIEHWDELPPAVRDSILILVRSAVSPQDAQQNQHNQRKGRRKR